jgi:sigma-B regulation protein RsbU (phosphoserine phosphatase)
MSQNAKSDILFISSIMVIPLILNKKILGVLSVVSKNPEQLFTKEDMEHLTTFGDYTSLTINNLFIYLQLLEKQEMEREVGIAAEIQGQLLPSRLPRVSSIKMAAYSLPAKGVSGDYYDVIPIKKGNVMLVMCDVAGKGLSRVFGYGNDPNHHPPCGPPRGNFDVPHHGNRQLGCCRENCSR